MSCSLCFHKGSCKVYEKLRELEDQLRDSVSALDFSLVLTTLMELEEEIAEKCRDYE